MKRIHKIHFQIEEKLIEQCERSENSDMTLS